MRQFSGLVATLFPCPLPLAYCPRLVGLLLVPFQKLLYAREPSPSRPSSAPERINRSRFATGKGPHHLGHLVRRVCGTDCFVCSGRKFYCVGNCCYRWRRDWLCGRKEDGEKCKSIRRLVNGFIPAFFTCRRPSAHKSHFATPGFFLLPVMLPKEKPEATTINTVEESNDACTSAQ